MIQAGTSCSARLATTYSWGGAGNDTLNGGAGFDTVDYSREGGTGNVYVNLGSGSFQVPSGPTIGAHQAQDTYGNTDTLSSIEHVITGAGNDYVVGSAAAEIIETGAGNDTIYSGGGGDTLIGGAGNDTYYASASDTIVEQPNGGFDQVLTSDAAYTLPANVETLIGILSYGYGKADAVQSLTGNDLDNVILGGSGNDRIDGGGGNDFIIGGAGHDMGTGGPGNDTFSDTAANLDGDTITDFSRGDKIVITDANLSGFSFSLSGANLTYTGGSMTLSNAPHGHLIASAAAGGGVKLQFAPAHSDFSGDGLSDLLWRNSDGTVTDWLGTSTGSFSGNWDNLHNNPGASWQVVGTGDFNGDGLSDIVWRNSDGTVTDWLGQANGSFSGNWDNLHNNPGSSWQVVGTGDFNGDGFTDILWRNSDGTVTDWLGQANGTFSGNWDNLHNNPGSSWQVVGTGDFNGDGFADILWRNSDGTVTDWLGQANGSFSGNWDNLHNNPGASWQVVGTGDFNGDGFTDILWRNSDGTVTDWLGTASGSFSGNWNNLHTAVPTNLAVVGIGDYNGDGIDDLLLRSSSGGLTQWLAQSNGTFTANIHFANPDPGASWQVQDPFVHDPFGA